MNSAAESILRKEDGLSIERGELLVHSAAQSSALRKAIRTAARIPNRPVPAAPDVLAVPRRSGARPYLLWLAPFVAGTLLDQQDLRVAVFIVDLNAKSRDCKTVLQQVFGLTAAETRVAVALASGTDLTQAAEEFGVSRNTVRTQLRAIFAKTATSRQSDLVRLLAHTERIAIQE